MKIGFFCQRESDFPLVEYLVASANKVMPGVPVYHLTNGTCKAFGEAIRISGDMPMGVRRLTHYSRLEGDWVLVDTDVTFRKDVRSVFDRPFDVALASRVGTIWDGSEYAKQMPHNFGVVFSKGPKFWLKALDLLKMLPPRFQEWEGEQRVTCLLADHPDFAVEILPSSYNFTPAEKGDDMSHVHIAHWKGPRKAWISA